MASGLIVQPLVTLGHSRDPKLGPENMLMRSKTINLMLFLIVIIFKNFFFQYNSAANNYGCSEELLEKRPCQNLPLCEPREPTGTFNPFEWTSSYSSGVYDNKFEIKNRLSGSSYLYDGSNSNAPNNMYQPSNNQQYRGGYNNRVQRPSYSDNYGNY